MVCRYLQHTDGAGSSSHASITRIPPLPHNSPLPGPRNIPCSFAFVLDDSEPAATQNAAIAVWMPLLPEAILAPRFSTNVRSSFIAPIITHNHHKEATMKSFMFLLAAATAALILGCQNPDASNPVAGSDNAVSATIAKPAPIPDPNVLMFDQRIGYTNSSESPAAFQAVGTVSFRITEVPTVPVCNGRLFDVQITVQGQVARLWSDMPPPRPAPWAFGGSTSDRIRIPIGQTVAFVKTFVVEGASVPTLVNMPFKMSSRILALGTMSLTKVKRVVIPVSNPQ